MLRTLSKILGDVARLRLPVTAAAAAATILAIARPFGIDPAAVDVEQITGAIAGVGLLAEIARRYVGTAGGTQIDQAGVVDPETFRNTYESINVPPKTL